MSCFSPFRFEKIPASLEKSRLAGIFELAVGTIWVHIFYFCVL